MSALELYLNEIATNRGLRRLNAMRGLRKYIKQADDEELLVVIRKMTDINKLKILIEAGLRQPLHDAVTRRGFELVERRG